MIWEWLAQYPIPMCRGDLLVVLLDIYVSRCIAVAALVGMIAAIRDRCLA